MDPEILSLSDDFDSTFSQGAMLLIVAGALLLRILPVLIATGAIIKLRCFPHLRPLHAILLISTLLLAMLALIETFAPAIVPDPLLTSGFWVFLWIFAIAWTGVSWIRSAIKTRLRPRALDLTTLAIVATAILALALPMARLV
ncbi:hypothetical protein [Gymnodinialimonas sp.]